MNAVPVRLDILMAYRGADFSRQCSEAREGVRPILEGSRMGAIRYNLFNYANYELSHSAFWAWILQCAEEKAASQYPGPHRVGCRFLKKAGMGEVASPVSVEREVRLPGLRDRLDIRFSDAKGRILAVETKVSAIPDVDQANRYLRALGTAGRLVLLSSAFDLDVRSMLPKGCAYVGLEEMETLLA